MIARDPARDLDLTAAGGGDGMDPEKLKRLIDLVSRSRIAELEIVEGKEKVRIVKATTSSPGASSGSTAGVAPAEGAGAVSGAAGSSATGPVAGHVVTATMYGILHLSPSPEEAPFVSVGDEVEAGRKLCLIEAMKVFTPVSSDRAGKVAAVLAASGSEVEAGQPLFRIE